MKKKERKKCERKTEWKRDMRVNVHKGIREQRVERKYKRIEIGSRVIE